MDRDREPAKTESEPCHTQLWSALERLDDSVEKMRLLHDRLAGTDRPAADTCEKEQPPPFIRVLSGATGRVDEARNRVDQLRADFENLCLQGASQ